MAMTTPADQLPHDELVARLFKEVSEKGYENIKASLPGLTEGRTPEKIYCEQAEIFYSPDIYAEKEGCVYVFEVSNAETIDLPSTHIELKTFAEYAKEQGAYFYLVVPSAIQGKAKSVIDGINERNERKSFVLPI